MCFSLLLASAAIYGCSTTVTRTLGNTDSALTITVYSNAVYLVVSASILLALELFPVPVDLREQFFFLTTPWQAPDLRTLVTLVFAAVLAGIGFFCLAHAYRIAPVSTVAPAEFSYVLCGLFFGYLVLGDLPGFITCLGALIVIACGIYIIRREATIVRAFLSK